MGAKTGFFTKLCDGSAAAFRAAARPAAAVSATFCSTAFSTRSTTRWMSAKPNVQSVNASSGRFFAISPTIVSSHDIAIPLRGRSRAGLVASARASKESGHTFERTDEGVVGSTMTDRSFEVEAKAVFG